MCDVCSPAAGPIKTTSDDVATAITIGTTVEANAIQTTTMELNIIVSHPYDPEPMVEHFVRTLNQAIKAAKLEGKDWKKGINIFLLKVICDMYKVSSH